MISPLELLAPGGPGGGVAGEGSGPAAALAAAGDGAPEVAVLAPAREEARSDEWREQALRLAAADGVAIVVTAPPDARLRRALRRAGYAPASLLLHAPDVERSRLIFPLGGAAAAYALRTLVPASTVERAAARLLCVTPVPLPLGPTSAVFARGARPPLDWLARLEPQRPSCTAVIARAWRPAATTVVYRFAGGREPDAVVKLGGGCAAEADALERLGAAAAAAGARVPAVLHRGEAGGRPLVVQTPLAGVAAPRLLAGSGAAAQRLLGELAGWLETWAEATAAPRAFTADDAERLLLAPARTLAPDLDSGALRRLEGRCDAATGRRVPFVAAHNDLTAANVLLAPGQPPAVVDWEHAAGEALPLGDLAYCAADLAAAVDDYRDRPGAFDACFAPGGGHAELVSSLLGRAAARAGLDPPLVDLCLAACWLRHAANERAESGGEDRPFLELLCRSLRRESAA